MISKISKKRNRQTEIKYFSPKFRTQFFAFILCHWVNNNDLTTLSIRTDRQTYMKNFPQNCPEHKT